MSDARARWNRRYRERGVCDCAHAPSSWLVTHREAVLSADGRRALDVACGDGRNAAYLAELGFEVHAVDVSDVAIDAVRATAADRGLAIDASQSDLEADGLPEGPYDVIVQINYLQRDLLASLARTLAPGGVLIVETFTRADREELGNGVGSRYLLEPGELPTLFPGLEVIDSREAVVQHRTRSRAVASLVARRPG